MKDSDATKNTEIELYRGRHGIFYQFILEQTIGASLKAYGEWAEEELYLMSHLVSEGGKVVDVGANIGTHSAAFSRFVGDRGMVIAIDAQFQAFRLLALNSGLNNFGVIVPINALVGSTVATMTMAQPDRIRDLAAVSFINVGSVQSFNESIVFPLPTITIDSLRPDSCNLMKIDVESMEYEVLLGSKETMAAYRPYVYFEQLSALNFIETCQLFSDIDYEMHWHVARPFNAANFTRNSQNIFGPSMEVNVLARPRERELPDAVRRLSPLRVSPGVYDPPLTRVDPLGWSLPDDAYAALAEPLAYRTDAVRLAELSQLHDLQLQFAALAADRKKAQEIMERQHRQLQELHRKYEGSA
jgi:FkbM family methyltransferase